MGLLDPTEDGTNNPRKATKRPFFKIQARLHYPRMDIAGKNTLKSCVCVVLCVALMPMSAGAPSYAAIGARLHGLRTRAVNPVAGSVSAPANLRQGSEAWIFAGHAASVPLVPAIAERTDRLRAFGVSPLPRLLAADSAAPDADASVEPAGPLRALLDGWQGAGQDWPSRSWEEETVGDSRMKFDGAAGAGALNAAPHVLANEIPATASDILVPARRGRAGQLSDEEYAELLKWGRQLQGTMGTLVTPPIGTIAPDVKAAKKFVESMIENLAGPQLKAQGIKLVVNIYGSDVVNAFAREFKSGEVGSPETGWRRQHSGQGAPWPIRRLYGIFDDQPFCELGITTGMLNRCATQGQLAFVIGHEITHLLERHTALEEFKLAALAKRWWSAQQFEVVADAGAVRLMKGKYDLHAAVTALTDFARLGSAARQGDIQAGTSDHHQPGFRIALAQMEVERQLTSSVQAHQPDQALPAFIKLGRMTPRPLKIQNFAKNLADFEVVADAIRADPEAAWIEDQDFSAIKRIRPGYSFQQVDDPEVLHRFLMAAVQRYLAEPQSSQDDVVVFFKLLYFIEQYYGGWELDHALQLLTLDEQARIRYFLARQARPMKRDPADAVFRSFNPSSCLNLAHTLQGLGLQRILMPLSSRHAKWRGFLKLVPRLLTSYSFNGRRELSDLRYLIENLSEEQDMVPGYKSAMLGHVADFLAELGRLPPGEIQGYFSEEFLNSSLLFYSILERARQHQGANDSAQWDHLAQAMAPLMRAYMRYRDQVLEELVARPDFAAQDQGFILRVLANPAMRDPSYPPRAEMMRSLYAALATVTVHWGTRNNWDNDKFESPQILWGEMLERVDFSFKQKLRVLEALASFQPLLPDEISMDKQKLVAGYLARFLSQPGATEHALRLLRRGEIGLVPLLGRDERQSRRWAEALPEKTRRAIIDEMLQRTENMLPPFLQIDGGRFLLDLLTVSQGDLADMDWWVKSLDRLLNASPLALQGRQDNEAVLRGLLNARLSRLAPEELPQKLKNPRILKTLSCEEAAEWLFRILPEPTELSRTELAAAVRALFVDYNLAVEFPAVERQLKILLARRLRLQPGETKLFFPAEDHMATERTSSAAGYIRGMSALVAQIQQHSPQEQLEALRYLLGDSSSLPSFLSGAGLAASMDSAVLNIIVQQVREWASTDNPLGRILVADSILAGPQGLLADAQGEHVLMEHILGSVGPSYRDLAHELALGVLHSHGASESLAAAYVLSSAGHYKGQGKTGEQALLKSLLVAHGAPGIKLGQFLAFTNPELRDALGDIQDNAQEFNELELLEAIEARFGDQWPSHYQVIGVLGTGSVNAGVELKDLRSGASVVMSMAYPDIEVRTAENFRRVERIIAELTRTESGERRFGYIRDLLPLIKDSVSLEFDKRNAFNMQKLAQGFYDRTIAGWKVQSVPVSALSHMSVFMGKAPGITARKLLERDPKTYLSVMRILSGIEYGLLMGDAGTHPEAVNSFFANPDFHDGQVLVDVVNKTITILDFGQAVPLSDSDRRLGLRILRAAAKFDSHKAVRDWVQKSFGTSLSEAEVREMLESSDRMGRFVKLVAKIRARGGKVPIAAVHWVMAVNRQLELSKKIGTHLDWKVGARLLASKFGLLD